MMTLRRIQSFCAVPIILSAVFCAAALLAVGTALAQEEAAPAAAAPGGSPSLPVKTTWPPKGTPAKFAFSRDLWISAAPGEEKGNNGGANQLKLKSIEEYTLFDADLSALKGKIITGCLWHFHCASPKDPFKRVTVSTLAAEWVGGTSSGYKEQAGSSCFLQAELGKRDWAYPGSNYLDVVNGRGHTIWKSAESTAPDENQWQAAAVDPDVVAARVAGLSHGFGAYDDVGNEWSYVNGTFTWTDKPNRFCHSREQTGQAPWLEIWTGGEDKTAPPAVADIKAQTKDMLPGTALVTWKTPADTGGGHTLGFNVKYEAGEKSGDVPRYLVPMAGRAGAEARMYLRDLLLPAGQEVKLTIAAVDSAGNVGPAATATIKVSDAKPFVIEPADLKPFEPSEKLPEVGQVKVAVLDLMDKVVAGDANKMIPPHDAGYRGGNHLYSAEKKLIRLQAARNEAVCFQLNFEGKADAVELKLDAGDEAIKPKLYSFDYVRGGIPDVCVPLKGALSVPAKSAGNGTNASALAELYVPHEVTPGLKKGKLTITNGEAKLELDVELTVWDFTLPNKLSFVPEMNAYGTADPGGNIGYYKLAHEHRCVVNRLYYGWTGAAQGPRWTGSGFDWADWDRAYGPLLDGSAFADLPRKGEPVDVFYLPFNENWPMDVYENFKASYWAEFAFTPAYRAGNLKAYADWARHADRKGWHETGFEFFLNNKTYYKQQSGWKGSSAPWLLDEPMSQQDFWALRWYGVLFHEAVDPVKGKARMWYRSDVSRSTYDRDCFRAVMDLECLGGANAQKIRMKQDEMVLWGRSYYTEYGSANDPKDANTQPAQWCLSAWTHGSVGVLPWDTMGAVGSATGVFVKVPGGPYASLRLKSFRQGQQDVEYLTLLCKLYQQPRWAVAAGLAPFVSLEGQVTKTRGGVAEDAGTVSFGRPDPTRMWQLRVAAAKLVSAKKPAYERVVEPLPNPPAVNLKDLPDIGYCPVAPEVPTSGPEMK